MSALNALSAIDPSVKEYTLAELIKECKAEILKDMPPWEPPVLTEGPDKFSSDNIRCYNEYVYAYNHIRRQMLKEGLGKIKLLVTRIS